MVNSADRDDELVAHTAPECTRLCKGEMMRIRRHAAAHEARLSQHKSPVILIAQANRFSQSTDCIAARCFLVAPIGAFWRVSASTRWTPRFAPGQHEAADNPRPDGHKHHARGRSRKALPGTAPPLFSRLQMSACSWQADSDAPRSPPRPPNRWSPVAQSGFPEGLLIAVLRGQSLLSLERAPAVALAWLAHSLACHHHGVPAAPLPA